MDIARISSKGQITIPRDVRKALGLKIGSKVIFIEENGRYYIENANKDALKEAQEAFKGAASKAGFSSEEELNAYVSKVRKEMLEEWRKGNKGQIVR